MSEFPEDMPEDAPEKNKGAPVDPALPEKALKDFKGLIKGNGSNPKTLILKNFTGETLDFEAYGIFKIDTSVSESRTPGKQQGEIAGSVSDVQKKISSHIEGITQNKNIRQLTVNMLKKRPDLGFALNDQIINLKRLNKTFVTHEGCAPCQSTGKILCSNCHGKRLIPCVKCRGQRNIQCHTCNGAQFITTQKGRQQCSQCHGRGRTGCTLCRQTGEVACPKCKSTGRMPCHDCSSSGGHSHIFHVSVHAKSRFDYDRNRLPKEATALIDEYGERLLTENHARIKIIEDVNKEEEINKHSAPDEYIVPYHVNIPWGTIEFSIKEKTIKGKLFGFNPVIKNMEPLLLETSIAKGLRLLNKAAQGQGNITQNISNAIRTRAIGEVFLATLPHSPKKALSIMQRRYPYAIKESTLVTMIEQAGKARKNLTKKPRLTGLAIGSVIVALFYALYFIAPLRQIILIKTEPLFPSIIPDIGSILITGTMITASIKITVDKALKQALGRIINKTKNKKPKNMPKIFKSALWGYPAALMLFAAILVLAVISGTTPPVWLF